MSNNTIESNSSAPATFSELYRSSNVYSCFEQNHRAGGTFGITLIDVKQDPIETVDPPVDEYFFGSPVGTWDHYEADFGDGWRCHSSGCRTVDVQPANTACALRISKMHLRALLVPTSSIEALLSSTGHDKAKLAAVSNVCRPLPHAADLVDFIWRALHGACSESNLLIDGALMQLVGHLLLAGGHGEGARASLPAIGDARLARAIDYLETHIARSLTVGELADVAAMSPSAFSRAFKTATGESVWNYVRRRRTERARELIEHDRLPLSAVADACGFADASHLSRTFRARYGKAPSDFM